jgi:hypothetical protein
MFIIGIFIPLFWIIGALMPAKGARVGKSGAVGDPAPSKPPGCGSRGP